MRETVTLADCAASKLLTGKAPKVLQALAFAPKEPQSALRPVPLFGDQGCMIDPRNGDFYRCLIDRRTGLKREMAGAKPDRRAELNVVQQGVKILANATSYGIFIELNVEDRGQIEPLRCFGPSGKAFPTKSNERPLAGIFIRFSAR
jgi:hypothetical protein